MITPIGGSTWRSSDRYPHAVVFFRLADLDETLDDARPSPIRSQRARVPADEL